MTGHGGNGYIKLQDTDVMLDEDLMRVMTESDNNEL
jgi:glycosylphosphatidylinositol transamidase (GPIT) subunit GPI8